ncbi:hypothetical protein N9896_01370 [bacterium]|nr:hypothetical protein [bacterium]
MKHEKTKIPLWFWVVSIFFLLWNIMGVFSFLAHTFISNEALAELPSNERELYGEYPLWTTIVFAIAVIAGMIGAIGLVLKKKWSKMAFVISLLAIIPQMIHNVFFTKSIEVYGTVEAVTMPALVVIFGLFLVWFSMLAIKKHWLN